MGPAARAWLGRVREWARAFEFTLARRFGIATREDRNFLLLIGLIGVVAGLLGLATEYLIRGVQTVLWGAPGDLLAVARAVPRWRVVVAPAAGGALVAFIIWLSRQAVSGEGMATLIEAVALSGGKLAPKPVLI